MYVLVYFQRVYATMKCILVTLSIFVLVLQHDRSAFAVATEKRVPRESSSSSSEQNDSDDVIMNWSPEDSVASGRRRRPHLSGRTFNHHIAQDDSDVFVSIPSRVTSILAEKRRRTSSVLRSASNVLSGVASDLLGNIGYENPTNYQANDRVSNFAVPSDNGYNPFPVVIVAGSQQRDPSPQSPTQQVSTSNQPSQSMFPLSPGSSSQNFGQSQSPSSFDQSVSANTEKGGQLAIPVASGGIVPPKNYYAQDQMIILDNVPWVHRTQNNRQPENVILGTQDGSGFGLATQGNNPSNGWNSGHATANNFGNPQNNVQSVYQGSGSNVFTVVDGIKEFTLDLIPTFRALGIRGNIVFSPVSIASLLSLLTLATNGETKHEIEVALNLPSTWSSDTQHQQFENILRRLNHVSQGLTINTSSRLFVKQSIPVFGSFTDMAANHYNCSVSLENFKFRPVRTQRRVNAWVEKETLGKIKKLVAQPFNTDTLFVAVNTIFFKGNWKTPFPKYFTAPRVFDTGTEELNIPMMTNVFETPHYFSELLNLDIVSIPYVGDQFAMFVILPRESPREKSIQQVESELDTFYIDELIHNMTTKQVSISLPKMRMSMKASLVHSLSQLNIQKLFSPTLADFSGFTNARPWVNEILHEAIIEINEIGTEAAAATIATLDRLGGFDRVNINKPAIIFIRDLVTGVPLFWTRLVKPELFE